MTRLPGPDNLYSDDYDRASGMPFHPTCFEIFKRASLYRYGFIDIENLVKWGTRRNGPGNEIPIHDAVRRGMAVQWEHCAGDEFLAANPCFIPGLQAIFDSVQTISDPDESCAEEAIAAPHATDVFCRLPQEIKLEILLQLDAWDIANLRLSSRAFRHLPQSLFYHLTVRELPWLYEAWTSRPLSFFVTTTAEEQRRIGKALNSVEYTMWKARRQNYESPEAVEEMQRLMRVAAELHERQDQRPTTPVTMLDRRTTNWTRLRGELTREWGRLPGLRNRRRIWNRCQDIMNRAELNRDKWPPDERSD
ncbi:hypothetical protein FBEOM_10246 [Fusarium beomiforme]|uniref:F-box domain-containing protein n=1 Tax=Fusarium beomiforme TaxID=44412 RepID=A0A9P5ACT8_9HYPO|nr:hypothetical protein FBEOM_10246 [Fusarium beomiforme]